ncbi:TlpA family protein disulfide reductase [Sediminibacterium roseum]|uniref:TlpA family protein disulfide reductase n=1 Tax=Sediminibacterium roseum TaxID=1978412 RepID=A0ABW9ZY25_9BACT|nr:TlpA disulfide reductase family protein [Sediminibacterium roseum]NCI52083.1 TlpA family protein disulfide reductase [Sediminibacterium roseum]
MCYQRNKLIVLLLLMLYTSCSVHHMYDGISKPVVFSADASVFDSTDNRKTTVSYADLLQLAGPFYNNFELSKDEPVQALIARPTLFLVNVDRFLVFPGDNLVISKKTNGEFLARSLTDETRTRELLVLNKFIDIEPLVTTTAFRDLSLEAFLSTEEQLKKNTPLATQRARQVFDSLQSVYQTSVRFRNATKEFVDNRHTFLLFLFYRENKDSLQARGLYQEKCRSLIPVANALTTMAAIEYNALLLNELVNAILPYNIEKLAGTEAFETDFNEIVKDFKGIAREYLLGRLIYAAYAKKLQVKPTYLDTYRSLASSGHYTEIINKISSVQSSTEEKTTREGNYLYEINRNKITTLEKALARHKGKLVFLDFMASWCAPCREDAPALKKLEEQYSKNEIVFINLSIDKEYQRWVKYMYAGKSKKENSFMFVDVHAAPFLATHKLETIPRYIVINRNGAVVADHAPRPGNGELKTLIDSLLGRH